MFCRILIILVFCLFFSCDNIPLKDKVDQTISGKIKYRTTYQWQIPSIIYRSHIYPMVYAVYAIYTPMMSDYQKYITYRVVMDLNDKSQKENTVDLRPFILCVSSFVYMERKYIDLSLINKKQAVMALGGLEVVKGYYYGPEKSDIVINIYPLLYYIFNKKITSNPDVDVKINRPPQKSDVITKILYRTNLKYLLSKNYSTTETLKIKRH